VVFIPGAFDITGKGVFLGCEISDVLLSNSKPEGAFIEEHFVYEHSQHVCVCVCACACACGVLVHTVLAVLNTKSHTETGHKTHHNLGDQTHTHLHCVWAL